MQFRPINRNFGQQIERSPESQGQNKDKNSDTATLKSIPLFYSCNPLAILR